MLFVHLFATTALASDLPCCTVEASAKSVEYYLAIHDALVREDSEAWRAPVLSWMSHLVKPKGRGLTGADKASYRDLHTLLAALARERSLDAVREAWPAVSRNVTYVALRHPGGDLVVREAECGGATFLARPGVLESPYLGCRPTWLTP